MENQAQKSTKSHLPQVSLPKGGGAINGIGEKFGTDLVSGSGTFSIPIPLSETRSGFGPNLALNYDSNSGNGPFGFGWRLSVPMISRRTEKGIPIYDDYNDSDEFVISGSEELVPKLAETIDGWVKESTPSQVRDGKTYAIHRYCPRTEGTFARIERWVNQSDPTDTFWRSITPDNVSSFFGLTPLERVVDPDDPRRIFAWLLSESRDDKGNAIKYEYLHEDERNLDLRLSSEANRRRGAVRYLSAIRYGNRTSTLINGDLSTQDWLFSVAFDYNGNSIRPETDDTQAIAQPVLVTHPENLDWQSRPDPFSTYRAGFEQRTQRRCARVLLYHHFGPTAEGGERYNGLVSSTDFDYRDLNVEEVGSIDEELSHVGSTRIASFIQSVQQVSYRKQTDRDPETLEGVVFEPYLRSALPSVEFDYSKARIDETVRALDSQTLQNLPAGFAAPSQFLADLDGTGLTGLLSETASGLLKKDNLGGAKFGPIESVRTIPSVKLSSDAVQLMDLAGDGALDIAELSVSTSGFFERSRDLGWHAYRAFDQNPNVEWQNPNTQLVDLTGDGLQDLMITEGEGIAVRKSLGERGYTKAHSIAQTGHSDDAPIFHSPSASERLFLGDMSGDGLIDLVRIRNGEVAYWPNLGYGNFGGKIVFDNSPHFDHGDVFDQSRLRLADIDGSGTTDIVYFSSEGPKIFFNQSGNRLSAPKIIDGLPPLTALSSYDVFDLLGNGTACLVWSSRELSDAENPVAFIDLMSGSKPHLMVGSRNNLGAETKVEYLPSTHYFLEDQRNGTPWVTHLPFPVHVVSRVETVDAIGRNYFSSRFKYHNGYFDGVEREFRGFGRVEQFDSERLESVSALKATTASNLDERSDVPPVQTISWFHTGASLYCGDLPDDQSSRLTLQPLIPDDLSGHEFRDACRALRGTMLRQEVYGLDGTERESRPYTITESRYAVRRVQPQHQNKHAVFYTYPLENLTAHLERETGDPRLSHTLTLEVDRFGTTTKSVQIAYGRTPTNQSDARTLTEQDRERQTTHQIVAEHVELTNAVIEPHAYRLPATAQASAYELTGFEPSGEDGLFTAEDFVSAIENNPESVEFRHQEDIAYESQPSSGRQRRLIERSCNLFRSDDLSEILPLGQLPSMALPGQGFQLSLTPGLLSELYGAAGPAFSSAITDAAFTGGGEGGAYVDLNGDGNLWIPSGTVFYSPDATATAAEELQSAKDHFFLPQRFRDPFHTDAVPTDSFVSYDDEKLLPISTVDAAGNRVLADNDYRTLQPWKITDQNGNQTRVLFDTLGLVIATSVEGKDGEAVGDGIDDVVPDLSATELAALFDGSDPMVVARPFLASATSRIFYDIHRFARSRKLHPDDPKRWQPSGAATVSREMHLSDLEAGQEARLQLGFAYSDGFGRVIQEKALAEPGAVPVRDQDGNIIVDETATPLMSEDVLAVRWVGSGWTVFNNKGDPVRAFEPFFSDTHTFEFDTRIGVSPVILYDPLSRAVAILNPDQSWEKVVFDPWQQESWDSNDTVLIANPSADPDVGGYFARLRPTDYLPTWHAQRAGGQSGTREMNAAIKAAQHAATPSRVHFDAMGRPFLTQAQNRYSRNGILIDETIETRTELDIEGNERVVQDARGRTVMRTRYDMLGNPLHTFSMDAGQRWMFNDIGGAPLLTQNARGHRVRQHYDQLRRPTQTWMAENGGDERLIGQVDYGETETDPEARNLRGQAVRMFDQAGRVDSEAFDFKGNLLKSSRRFTQTYDTLIDWESEPDLQPTAHITETVYDGLNRPTNLLAPDGSRHAMTFNSAGFLETVSVRLNGQAETTRFVENIDYDAKGQRSKIEYSNGVVTHYERDRLTDRLTRLHTLRGSEAVQDYRYVFDPVGNICSITDHVRDDVYFDNQVTNADRDYTYDAVYRLIEATGREHLGLVGTPHVNHDDGPRTGKPHKADAQAMRSYREFYEYDQVGNFERLRHTQGAGNWTREYAYTDPSPLDPGQVSNRLTRTTVGAGPETPYTYDLHGNMTAMPHLDRMDWDFADRLRIVERGTMRMINVYDASGVRVRKVVEKNNGNVIEERQYLGAVEYDLRHNGTETPDRVRETVHVMDDETRIALVETDLEASAPAPLILYQFSDHLGSVSLELNEAAAFISYEEYYPYGATSFQSGRNAAEVSLKRYRFTGMERDEETGLALHGARYYAPWLGRWTAADPAGLVDGPNLYRHVSGNPIGYKDQEGKSMTAADLPDIAILGIWQGSTKELSALGFSRSDHDVIRARGLKLSGARADRKVRKAIAKAETLEVVYEVAKYHPIVAAADTTYHVGKAISEKGIKKAVSDKYDETVESVSRVIEDPVGVGKAMINEKIDAAKRAFDGDLTGFRDLAASGSSLKFRAKGAELGVGTGVAAVRKAKKHRKNRKRAKRVRGRWSDNTKPTNPDSVVYRLIDEGADPNGFDLSDSVYFGETMNVRATANRHEVQKGKNWRGMQVISKPMSRAEAFALEGSLNDQFGIDGIPVLSREKSSFYKMGGNRVDVDQIRMNPIEMPTETILNPDYYKWAAD